MSCKSPAFTLSRRAFDAVIFDLDGVVTQTAAVHAAAWKQLFDAYLKQRAARTCETYDPFDIDADYRQYVDGKPRYEGIKSFLESRSITLPYGDPDDPPDRETVCGLGNRKNQAFRERLQSQGVAVYPSSVQLIEQLRAQGIKTAIVSSSKNCAAVLETAGIASLFAVKVDGVDAVQLNLKGKPDPDIFLETARQLGVDPARAVVVEDAIAGVQAGRRGRFGCVIGVARNDNATALKENGADVVVTDLAELAVSESDSTSSGTANQELPSALECLEQLVQQARGKRLAVFLDYDGTLTPIVERPELAVLAEEMRDTVRRLAKRCTVAVVSGRDLPDVQRLVGIEQIFYAGSHGFDIAGPKGQHQESQQGTEFLPDLDKAEQALNERLAGIAGVLIERKKFSIAIHYRQVAKEDVATVERVVDEVQREHARLKKSTGKKIYELQPNIDWHKGRAVRWLLKALQLDRPEVLPVFIGDDVTDEDAFRALEDDGIGIVVLDSPRPSAARYRLQDPAEVQRFLEELSARLEEKG